MPAAPGLLCRGHGSSLGFGRRLGCLSGPLSLPLLTQNTGAAGELVPQAKGLALGSLPFSGLIAPVGS